MLDASFATCRGALSVEIDLHIAAGEVAVIVGPNGAGKTTIIRAIAGLDAISSGDINVDGNIWNNESTHTEAAKRSTSLVLADPLLFPNLSIEENVAFGVRARGLPRKDSLVLARDWLQRVGLASYALNRPAELSTGQQQRASLVRALAIDPQVLLLDEPLSAQDFEAKAALRNQLRALLADFSGCTVWVTHDPVDALSMGSSVVVLEDGRVTQSGTPQDVVRRPATPFVAKLLGLNLMRGSSSNGQVAIEGGGTFVVAADLSGPVQIAFAPHSVTLSRPLAQHSTQSSQRNRWTAEILELEPLQGKVRVTLSGPPSVVAEVTPQAVADLGLGVGEQVEAAVKATEVEVYPA